MSSIYVFTTYIRRGATCSSVTYILVNNYMYISENALLLPIRCCLFMLISPKCESRKALDLLTIQVATTTECFSYFAWKLVGCSFLSETLPLSFFHIKTEAAQQQYHLQSSFTMQKCTHYSTTSFKWHFPSSLKILSMVFERKGIMYVCTTCHTMLQYSRGGTEPGSARFWLGSGSAR